MTIPQPSVMLNNGVEIPLLGLGTYQAHGKSSEQAVSFALKHGYSLIDTAQGYNNEEQVGTGWKSSGRPRQEIFITTKISNSNQGYDRTLRSFEKSLSDLQSDYVDLLLIHWPEIKHFERTVETWQALIDLQSRGLCRSIGVSNFTIALIEKLLSEINVIPAVNQVEFHTFLYQKDLLDYCQNKKIQIEAYSPIAKAKLFDNEVLQGLGQKYKKTPAQIMLAWGVNHGLVVIPKSVNPARIEENADIFFEIEEEDMTTLNTLEPQIRLVNGIW